ncbi:CpXC domain-containing protein [Floccifex sp.]|uniref:CpXC domain-containing protein n=1 Tax=Floccifex sp. TaxID=2815810 RepID=UPI002A763029|nr:CpXC domain-containing protein [Floccifex sp.]MDD7281819.1 CpXC domain-containing protein [Erysipelotrichaceae bacterium]MDY2958504.1 CpXC domain-containing protein [Floccifex sp.]
MEKSKITCPKCNEKTSCQTWKYIDISKNPGCKNKLLNQSLFKFKCRNCGYEALLDYSLQYCDPEQKINIYYVTNQEELDEVMDLFQDDDVISDTKDYRNRVVCSQEDLIEKIQLFDMGLDDRIIEIMKVLFYKQIKNQYQVDAIRCTPDLEIKFYFQDFEQGKISFDLDLYHKVENVYQNLEEDVRIDFDWAVEAMS